MIDVAFADEAYNVINAFFNVDGEWDLKSAIVVGEVARVTVNRLLHQLLASCRSSNGRTPMIILEVFLLEPEFGGGEAGLRDGCAGGDSSLVW